MCAWLAKKLTYCIGLSLNTLFKHFKIKRFVPDVLDRKGGG